MRGSTGIEARSPACANEQPSQVFASTAGLPSVAIRGAKDPKVRNNFGFQRPDTLFKHNLRHPMSGSGFGHEGNANTTNRIFAGGSSYQAVSVVRRGGPGADAGHRGRNLEVDLEDAAGWPGAGPSYKILGASHQLIWMLIGPLGMGEGVPQQVRMNGLGNASRTPSFPASHEDHFHGDGLSCTGAGK